MICSYLGQESSADLLRPLPFRPPPPFLNLQIKFTIVLGHGPTLTLTPNFKGLNPNPKS